MLRKLFLNIFVPALFISAALPAAAQARREIRFNIIGAQTYIVQPYHGSIVLPTGWRYIPWPNQYDQNTSFFAWRTIGEGCDVRGSFGSFESAGTSPANTFLQQFVLEGATTPGGMTLRSNPVGGTSWQTAGTWNFSATALGSPNLTAAYAGASAYRSASTIDGSYIYPGFQAEWAVQGCTESQLSSLRKDMRATLASFQLVGSLTIPRPARHHHHKSKHRPTFTG